MNDLSKLARGLMQLAVEKYDDEELSPDDKIVRHMLRGGLRIALKFNAGEWLIAFWRCGVVPSETELQTCVRDFGIPANAMRSPEQRKTIGPNEWHGFAFAWAGPREPAPEQAELVNALNV